MMGNAGFYIINPRRVVLQEFGTHCPRGSGPSLTERSKVAGAHDSADGEAEPRPDTPWFSGLGFRVSDGEAEPRPEVRVGKRFPERLPLSGQEE